MANETFIVDKVDEGTNGWYEITLKDGRMVSTKNKKFAEHAHATRGSELEGELNEVKRGKFTNIYLNSLDGVEDEARSTNGGSGRPRRGGGGRSPAEQDRIARQWAYGRAVELLATSTQEFTMPLDSVQKKALEETADWLLSQTK